MHPLFPQIPLWLLMGIVATYGLIIGSFLNVFLYRFHTGKSLSGKSHCLSCGVPLRSYDLIPVLSYVFLRGRCRKCGSHIPVRYLVVEGFTAGLFLLSAFVASSMQELVLLLIVSILAVLIVVYDIRHLIIPDELTITLTFVAVSYRILEAWQRGSYELFLFSLGATALGMAFFYFLWFVSKGQWIGFGDVKLIFPLGLLVGPTLVFSLIVYSFWIGAGVSLLIIGLARLQRGKLRLHLPIQNLTIKSVVPFAPFLIAGCLLTLFTEYNVLNLFSFLS